MSNRSATCHPEREYYAKGMCNACYMVDFRNTHPRYRDYNREYAQAWRKQNEGYTPKRREKAKSRYDIQRKSNLKLLYGLTTEQYNDMLSAQDNKCKICSLEFVGELAPSQLPCVDHDHTTGAVRAILCRACNVGIGNFYESADRLVMAAAYIKSFKEQ